MFRIVRVNNTHEDFVKLIQELDIELNLRYGIAQTSLNQFNKIDKIQTAVLGYI